jgi:hypothetical protein
VLEVLHYLVGFGLNVARHQLARGLVDGNLPRHVQGVAGLHGLAVRPDGRRRLVTYDSFFHGLAFG